MKIKVKTEQEIEVQLPLYSKLGNYHYFAPNEKMIISVWMLDNSAAISIRDAEFVANDVALATSCSKEEFMLAYNTARILIDVEVNKTVEMVGFSETT